MFLFGDVCNDESDAEKELSPIPHQEPLGKGIGMICIFTNKVGEYYHKEYVEDVENHNLI